jgi:cyclic beta-1,2-glucan synthetase
MTAVEDHLVDHEAGLLKLLSPPLQRALPSAGYIQAYPKGVRENGGQYSHAGVWALIAQAMRGEGDAAYRYFTYLSPAHRAAHPERHEAYEIEPYVMAGDVYTHAPYVGRGGWSWYTGSAAWLHRAVVESMFGMRQSGPDVAFAPCLPSHWDHAEITLRRGGRLLRVIMCRPAATEVLARAQREGAVEKAVGAAWRWDTDDAPGCVLLRLEVTSSASDEADASATASRPRPTAAGAALRWAGDGGVPTVHSPTTTP